jgi:deoxyribonuclease-1
MRTTITERPANLSTGKSSHSSGEFSCEEKKTCGQMTSCEEAKYHLNTCGNKRLDRDRDHVPCESICK